MRRQASSLEPTVKPPKYKRSKLPPPQLTSVPTKRPPTGQPAKKFTAKPEVKLPALTSSVHKVKVL